METIVIRRPIRLPEMFGPPSLCPCWPYGAVASYAHPPEACLVNLYDCGPRMGLHQDRDEPDLAAPVVSISLGDRCCFRYGGSHRGDPAKKLELCSGDIVVMGGAARLMFHGMDKVFAGSSGLLPGGGSISPCGG
jgi:DNA oxidative demethylase